MPVPSPDHKENCATGMGEDVSEESPIIIIGGGRSGTTLARYILNAHPNIYIAEEIAFHFWINFFRGDIRARLGKYFNTFSYVWLRQDPEKVLARFPKHFDKQLDKRNIPLIYKTILQVKAEQFNRRRYGEKNPLLTTALDKIYQDFPKAKVINLIRDPRANVFSHTTMPWSTGSLLLSNSVLAANYNIIKKHGDRILNVKLEDLIAKPKQTIATMLEFVEEPWSDRVLDHTRYTLKNEGIPFPWLSEASKERKTKSKKWAESLSPAWIRIIERTNREQMEDFGYCVHEMPGSTVSFFDRVATLAADIPNLFFCTYRILRMMLLLAITHPRHTWKVQAIMHSMNPKGWDDHPDWERTLARVDENDRYREQLIADS